MRYIVALVLCSSVSLASADDGRRLSYRDEANPYYPDVKFPKLITPQWVGEEGVEAVVILAIDDMRDTAKYEQYLRPILQRLKQIDGRAPVSIMANRVKPDDPQLQSWLDEGLSIEAHTIDHPCPLLKDDLPESKSTYDRCVDLLQQIPGNKPVAFRMPCCDSLNTVSPRFFAEIFSKGTAGGNYLQIDSSVFNFFTADDPDIPRDLILGADGRDRFLKYMPRGRGFVNYIENYPYPYVVNGLCWEFPCVAPSDWSAQHLHGANNPLTVADWKAAIDITVVKQGVFCLVFHPHGWIRNDQIVELIDHAVQKHGKAVRFLTFRDAAERLNANLMEHRPLRPDPGEGKRATFSYVRIGDSRFRIVLPARNEAETRISKTWYESSQSWKVFKDRRLEGGGFGGNGAWGGRPYRTWHEFFADVDGDGRIEKCCIRGGAYAEPLHLVINGFPIPTRFLLPRGIEPFLFDKVKVREVVDKELNWGTTVEEPATPPDLPGLKFIDLDSDGDRDLVFSDAENYAVYLFDYPKKRADAERWTVEIVSGRRGDKDPSEEIPPIVNADGTNNGFFIHGRAMYWQNENTSDMPHLVDVRTFDQLLGKEHQKPQSAAPADRR